MEVGKKTGGDAVVINPKLDRVRKMFGSLREKSLKNALAHVIGRDFPRIGGERIRALCAEMILDVVAEHLRPREHLRHGQVLWLGIDINDPPSRGKRTADTDLVPVVLDLSTDEDILARIDRVPVAERLRMRAVRLALKTRANPPPAGLPMLFNNVPNSACDAQPIEVTASRQPPTFHPRPLIRRFRLRCDRINPVNVSVSKTMAAAGHTPTPQGSQALPISLLLSSS